MFTNSVAYQLRGYVIVKLIYSSLGGWTVPLFIELSIWRNIRFCLLHMDVYNIVSSTWNSSVIIVMFLFADWRAEHSWRRLVFREGGFFWIFMVWRNCKINVTLEYNNSFLFINCRLFKTLLAFFFLVIRFVKMGSFLSERCLISGLFLLLLIQSNQWKIATLLLFLYFCIQFKSQ